METQNVTLSVRKDILRKAKIVAVKRGTSLSRLMNDALEAIADEQDSYEQAEHRQIALMDRGLDWGTYGAGPAASRDELHRQPRGTDWRDRITVDPGILVGKPVVRGTRLAVEFIVDLLAQGWSEADILSNYPGLTREDIRACLAYAGAQMRAEKVYPLETPGA